MKKHVYHTLLALIYIININAQGGDSPLRGPVNMASPNVIDGVVVNDELPIRSKIEYEHVRLADYVWSKRVFSRIDKREKINHVLFFPYDYFEDDGVSSIYKPKSISEVDDPSWNKDLKRWSLWTIIMRHLILGDLTAFKVSSESNELVEDGYNLKYPISKSPNLGNKDYFESPSYNSSINKLISSGGMGKKLRIYRQNSQDTVQFEKTNQTFQKWYDSLALDSDYEELTKGYSKSDVERWWNATGLGLSIRKDRISKYLASNNIVAFNIKEDWFFDKERSILDRRIIAIAPVARYTMEDDTTTVLKERGKILSYDLSGVPFYYDDLSGEFIDYKGLTEEKEMFWLYFPELRDVIINYYVYNEQSDAQWMSFDDLFWKRKFSSTIFRVSDKFDREIEDYKYGVDALYESEKIKDDIRKWEIDVWNY